jgi:ABC-type multidrug transport system fused ATPase/permease subunit
MTPRMAGMSIEELAEPPKPRPGLRTMIARANQLIQNQRRSVAALAFVSLLSGLTESTMLALVAQVAVALVNGNHRAHVHLGGAHINASIGTLILIAFVMTFLRLALQFPVSYLPARISANVQAGVRRRLFHAFTRSAWGTQAQDHEGQLQETITSQVMQATGASMQLTTLLNSLITFTVLLCFALALNPLAAVLVLAVSVSGFLVLRPVRGVGVRRARSLSIAQLRFAGGVAEAVRLAEETHVFGAGAAQRRRVDKFISHSRTLFFKTQVLVKLVPNLYMSLLYILVVGGIFALYETGRGKAGSLGAIVLILLRASTAGQAVQSAYQGLSLSMPFIERTQAAEQRYLENSPTYGRRRLERVESIAFEQVGFAYRPDQPVLTDITFEVAGRESIGIVGPSGAGKSTLVQLLLRLRDPTSGECLVNGIPAAEYTAADWTTRVAYVPQEPRVLHASVRDNIRFFRELDDEAVERAGRLARIHEEIMSWADGYDTVIGPRADAVSGGQKQRVCLARALAAEPEVLVLDEPTSALDPHSEKLIGASLSTLRHQLTLFVVAHRMSTLDICDRVMVIVGGELVAFDTRDLLEAENSYYRSASAIAAGTAEASALE